MEIHPKLMKVIELIDSEFQFPLNYHDCSEIARRLRCNFANGETRWCFWFENVDEVIKIPRFDGDRDFDYCKRELHNYALARQYRVEAVLLPIRYVGCFGGSDIYVQPKFTYANSDMNRNQHKELKKKLGSARESRAMRRSWNKLYYCMDDTWYARVLQLYGKKFLASFEKFSNDAKLNDLHNGNIGWRNGRPIILDYAGYQGHKNVQLSF